MQPILFSSEGISSDLTVFFNSEESTYDVYLGVALLEKINISKDNIQHKMLVGRLRNAGAKFCDLKKAFGHDRRTVKKWAEALKSNDVDIIAEAFAGRIRNRKLSPPIIRYTIQQYISRETLGKNYREIIIQKINEVFKVEISPSLASTIFKNAKSLGILEDLNEDSPSEKWSTDVDPDLPLNLEIDEPVQQSTIFTETLKEPSGENVLIHHLGLIFFSLWLRLYPLLNRQFICQLLQGAVNIDSSKLMCYQSLCYFCPKIVAVQQEQRNMFDKKSNFKNIIKSYQRNNSLLFDGPGKGKEFFFDPHTKEYTGQLKVLKGWCGSKHGVSKIVNLDSFHTASGRPCFIQHYSPYYDMRERFFMSLKFFDQLFPKEKRQGRTFIIDRGIYGLDTLKLFDKDYVITWEKGYKNGDDWDENKKTIKFTKNKHKNNKKDVIEYRFKYQESKWNKVSNFRKIVVKAQKYKKDKQVGKEVIVSIISSNLEMSTERTVWLIFNRWLQENDFKYLDLYFGINQLDSNAYDSFETRANEFKDKLVDTPEYKKLKSKLIDEENKLARCLLNLKKKDENIQKMSIVQKKQKARIARRMKTKTIMNMEENQVRKDKKLRELKTELKQLDRKKIKLLERKKEIKEKIVVIENDLEKLATELIQGIKQKSRIQMLIDKKYQKLNTRRKAYLDAQRINAANQFRNLHDIFREISNNYRDDHMKLRMLTRCSGFIRHSSDKININLWLPGSLQAHVIKNMQTFASIVETKINLKNKKENIKPISIKLLPGTIKVMQKKCI